MITRERLARAPGAGELDAQALVEPAAVERPGQRVALGVGVELLDQALDARVELAHEHARHGKGADRRDPAGHPDVHGHLVGQHPAVGDADERELERPPAGAVRK